MNKFFYSLIVVAALALGMLLGGVLAVVYSETLARWVKRTEKWVRLLTKEPK